MHPWQSGVTRTDCLAVTFGEWSESDFVFMCALLLPLDLEEGESLLILIDEEVKDQCKQAWSVVTGPSHGV